MELVLQNKISQKSKTLLHELHPKYPETYVALSLQDTNMDHWQTLLNLKKYYNKKNKRTRHIKIYTCSDIEKNSRWGFGPISNLFSLTLYSGWTRWWRFWACFLSWSGLLNSHFVTFRNPVKDLPAFIPSFPLMALMWNKLSGARQMEMCYDLTFSAQMGIAADRIEGWASWAGQWGRSTPLRVTVSRRNGDATLFGFDAAVGTEFSLSGSQGSFTLFVELDDKSRW